MAGNSGESKMGANQQIATARWQDPIHAVAQGIRMFYLACLICWPQAQFALCRFLGT
jgi:hypothetical protein